MKISLIVAMSENRVIGRGGALPWHLSADLRRFKQITMGHSIIMGRKTFESIGRLLPGRTSIVLSRQSDLDAGGALVAPSLEEALRLAAGDDEAFIIGGEEVYRLALPVADRLYVTAVHAHLDGDRWFPELSENEWRLGRETRHPADEKNGYDYSFRLLERQWSKAS